jgi:hypothetical protein
MMTVGHQDYEYELKYVFYPHGLSAGTDFYLGAWFSDNHSTGWGLRKNFGLGSAKMHIFRRAPTFFNNTYLGGEFGDTFAFKDTWEILAGAELQFTEQFGFDVGFGGMIGDDSTGDFNSLWSYFAGLRFDFNENIGLKGLFYHQRYSVDVRTAANRWEEEKEDANAFKAIVDVKQDLLGFTSLWLEYAKANEGFGIPYGNQAMYFADGTHPQATNWGPRGGDHSVIRVGAVQKWNDKWTTWLYFAHHNLADFFGTDDLKGNQWAVGFEYRYNPNVVFALNYINMSWDDEWAAGRDGDNRIQFRTYVSF